MAHCRDDFANHPLRFSSNDIAVLRNSNFPPFKNEEFHLTLSVATHIQACSQPRRIIQRFTRCNTWWADKSNAVCSIGARNFHLGAIAPAVWGRSYHWGLGTKLR